MAQALVARNASVFHVLACAAGLTVVALLAGSAAADSAPTFVTPVAGAYSIIDGGLTIGVDGADLDGDDLTITAVSDNPDVLVYIPRGNSYAQMNWSQVTGSGTVALGSILVQLFDGRSPLATDQFKTLAQNEVLPDGTLNPAGTPFYTDVPVHRVIDNFMVQTGDAVKGDGTGGSPLGTFDNEYHQSLGFSSRGAMATANSGLDTNDAQLFLTDVPTPWLRAKHTISGQVVSGWDTYETIISTPVTGSVPDEPIFLDSVQILPASPQDGTVSIYSTKPFAGEAHVTVTMSDSNGNQTSEVVNVTYAGVAFDRYETGRDDYFDPPSLGAVRGVVDVPDLSIHGGDLDYWEFTLAGTPGPGSGVDIFFTQADGDLDLALFKINPDGSFPGQANAATETDNEHLDLEGLEAGNYLLRVLGYAPQGAPPPPTDNHYSMRLDVRMDAPAVPGDFDGNGVADTDDIDALQAEIGRGTNEAFFDVTGDGLVDPDDLGAMLHDVLGTEFGDLTLDRKVDGADLSLMAANWLAPGGATWADGDLTGDGKVDGADLSLMAANWLFDGTAPPATVPEPATILLLLCGACGLLGRRRR